MLSVYWSSLKDLATTVRRSLGKFPRECVVCGYHGKFLGHGYPFVCDILCPHCGSLGGHRLLALADREYDFFRDRDIIHFSPTGPVRRLVLEHRPRSYVMTDSPSADDGRGDDIEALNLQDSSFDVAICLDVLQHVDDRKAARELYRVLRPGGMLLATFPIVEGWDATFEGGGGMTPEERLLFFGERGHARYFGRDARDRLAAPGFIVEEYTAIEPNVSRLGLARGDKLFICSRPPAYRSAVRLRGARAGMTYGLDRPVALHSVSS